MCSNWGQTPLGSSSRLYKYGVYNKTIMNIYIVIFVVPNNFPYGIIHVHSDIPNYHNVDEDSYSPKNMF